MIFIIEEAKETILGFSQEMKVLWVYLFKYERTQCNINVKLPNSQVNKLKSGIKNY